MISVSLSLVLIGWCLLSLSSLLLSSLSFSLFFSSILLSSLLPCRLIWWPHPCLTALSLSLPSLLFSPPLSLFGWFGGLIPASLALSLVLVGWLFPSLVWAGWLLFLSLVLAGLHFLSLSLSLFSLWFWLGGFSFHVFLFGGFSHPIFSCVLAGWCLLSPFCLYTLFCCLGGFLPLRLSLSFSRSYWWAGVFPSCGGWVASPPPSLVSLGGVCSLPLSLPWLSLSLFVCFNVVFPLSRSPSLPLSRIGWLVSSLSCVGTMASLSCSCVGCVAFPLSPSPLSVVLWLAGFFPLLFLLDEFSFSLSLSLSSSLSLSLSILLVRWLLHSRVLVGWFLSYSLSRPLLCWLGGVCSPSLYPLSSVAGVAYCLSLSLSLGWRFPLLRWLGGFSPSVSLVSLGGVCAPSPSLTVYSLLSLLSLLLVGWLLPSAPLSISCICWVASSLSCLGPVASSLSLSLSPPLVCWLGGVCSRSLSLWLSLSFLSLSLFCWLEGFFPSPALSRSLSLSLSLVLVGRPHLQSKWGPALSKMVAPCSSQKRPGLLMARGARVW